jgi:hypothetical protein
MNLEFGSLCAVGKVNEERRIVQAWNCSGAIQRLFGKIIDPSRNQAIQDPIPIGQNMNSFRAMPGRMPHSMLPLSQLGHPQKRELHKVL